MFRRFGTLQDDIGARLDDLDQAFGAQVETAESSLPMVGQLKIMGSDDTSHTPENWTKIPGSGDTVSTDLQ